MPRHNHPAKHRKSRHPRPERVKIISYEGIARTLVVRGLANSTILTPGEPLTHQPPRNPRDDQ